MYFRQLLQPVLYCPSSHRCCCHVSIDPIDISKMLAGSPSQQCSGNRDSGVYGRNYDRISPFLRDDVSQKNVTSSLFRLTAALCFAWLPARDLQWATDDDSLLHPTVGHRTGSCFCVALKAQSCWRLLTFSMERPACRWMSLRRLWPCWKTLIYADTDLTHNGTVPLRNLFLQCSFAAG